MRSDYYTPPTAEIPLRPLTPPAPHRRKKRRHALPLFIVFLVLLGGCTLFLAWKFGPPFLTQGPIIGSPPQPGVFPTAIPQETTVRRLAPPVDVALSLHEVEGTALTPQEIYTSVSPSVVLITAMTEHGSGSEGSGIIFDTRGYCVTNAHVIEGTASVSVTLSNGRDYPAFLIGMDAETDLAVLKFSAPDLTAAPFGMDSALLVGDTVYAIGNPLGNRFQGSLTDGIVSAIDRNVTVGGYEMSLIQTTAALNQGSSGGALVNVYGQVVGITNMKMMSWASTVEGLGFAIPTSTAEQIVNDILSSGYALGRPMLGITVRAALVPQECSLPGLYVESVHESSDAWAKGLRPGDVLLTGDDTALETSSDLLRIRERKTVGESLCLTWLTGGKGASTTADVLLMEQYQVTN